MDEPAADLLMTLADVAALANVQRPVVSMWRTRSASTAEPFPAPLRLERGLEVFAGHQVAAWLTETGRGNNPEALNDLAAFARIPEPAPGSAQPGSRPNFDGLTALLTLKVMTGSALGSLSSHELMDTADECDPDDLFLYSELHALGTNLASLADFADRLADSAYNAAEALERLLTDRFRSGLREHSDTALSDSAVDLVAGAAVELAGTLGGEPVFVESAKGGSDLLLGVVQKLGDSGPFTVLTSDDDCGAARLVRRRLRVHGVDSVRVATARSEGSDVGPVVHMAQYPSPGEPGMDPARILSAIEHTVLQMDDEQRAVIVAPARVLSDAPLTASPAELRSGLLRSGRVRAIVRLPQGLLRSKPREAQALWVLGPSFADVEIADKWTMVADLGTGRLSDDVIQDLLSDVVASMGDLPTVRAHSFRFARLVRTSVLLAGRGSLVTARKNPSAPRTASQMQPADVLIRIEELLRRLNAGSAHAESPLNPTYAPLGQDTGLRPARVTELMGAGHLRYVKGNRLEDADLAAGPGTRTIGTSELLNPHAEPSRHISLLDFAAKSPTGRLTAPGDVVFCTSPRPLAMVDAEGGSVVVFPARVLRIDAGDPGGLVPDVVAADMNGLPAGDKDWKNWQLRRLPDAQRQPLTQTLARLQHEQQRARERLEQLKELATLITDGVAGGSLSLTDPISNAAAPTEGMH